MYSVSAAINDVKLVELPLTSDFQIDVEELNPYLKDEALKLIFICSPNNPTGNCFEDKTIQYILREFKGIVIIDEAYIDFSTKESYISLLNDYPNLIISQTFSKAWGLAGVRVGVAYANSAIIDIYNKVKSPYNVSILNQKAVLEVLEDQAKFEMEIATIVSDKKLLTLELKEISFIEKIYPSDTNFLLIKVDNAIKRYNQLISEGIVVRNRTNLHLCKDCLRVSIGDAYENEELIMTLKYLDK